MPAKAWALKGNSNFPTAGCEFEFKLRHESRYPARKRRGRSVFCHMQRPPCFVLSQLETWPSPAASKGWDRHDSLNSIQYQLRRDRAPYGGGHVYATYEHIQIQLNYNRGSKMCRCRGRVVYWHPRRVGYPVQLYRMHVHGGFILSNSSDVVSRGCYSFDTGAWFVELDYKPATWSS